MSDLTVEADVLVAILDALDVEIPDGSTPFAVLAELLDDEPGPGVVWFVLAALREEIPVDEEVVRFRRDIRLNGGSAALLSLDRASATTPFGSAGRLRLITDAVIVDVGETVAVERFSGIQRVVRETVGRWVEEHPDIVLVSWTEDKRSLRPLTALEDQRIRGSRAFVSDDSDEQVYDTTGVRIVPLRGRYLMPELAAEVERAQRIAALGQHSDTVTGFIGYDCVPMTTSETTIAAMSAQFPLYLDAMAYASAVVPISAGALNEFAGWKRMLPASGRTGPKLTEVFLAADARADESDVALPSGLTVDDSPIVLVVGTHEPRKNHLSVLHAARLLWDSGVRFQLVMIGSGSWESAGFEHAAHALRSAGYPLVIRRSVDDPTLTAAYRAATVSVFTSLNEGFGLPIVESLQAGTPVIASNVGSMREIAERYRGVLTVDPRSDRDLTAMLRRALTDPTVLAEARRELVENDYVTWDDYAAETWRLLTE